MRLLTWNINGVRTLPQYHPWNTLKTFDDILNHLEADILCFQEMKSSRQGLPKPVALPPSFESFFSFPLKKSGYSGVATYVRRSTGLPLKAEEGLTGIIQPRPSFEPHERISTPTLYPPDFADPAQEEIDVTDLDSEGRAITVDLGLFVLINVYCPNDGTGTEEREKFKMQYHRLLEKRVRDLISEGREVILVGDLNACAAVEDHCEGRLMVERGLAEGLQGEEGFWGKEYRRWIRDLITTEGGCMVDIVRKLWPDRKGLYTCWNTKISARDTNYGTRIDFILITPGLVPWVKTADIQPHIKGSDHCPVYVDFRDEIVNSDGSTTRLPDVLGAQVAEGAPLPDPPRIAARHWEEHRQKLLSTFFGKKTEELGSPEAVTPLSATLKASSSEVVNAVASEPPLSESRQAASETSVEPSSSTTTKRKLRPESPPTISTSSKKVKSQAPRKDASNTKGKTKHGQSTLGTFFTQPRASTMGKSKSGPSSPIRPSSTLKPSNSVLSNDADSCSSPIAPDEDADFLFALSLSQSEDTQSMMSSQTDSSEVSSNDKGTTKQAWTSLLAPTQRPKCTVHGEPAKEYTVNKSGPNKGKKFFLCSRPVGPGYDKGRSERPREQVDPQYKCNYFKWSSEVRREMSKKGDP